MKARGFLGLLLAVLAISWGAPLARMTQAAPLAVAMWRMLLAIAILIPLTALRQGLALPRKHLPVVALSGLLLGMHFGLWIPSLWLTSVSASVILVTTQSLWILLLSPRFLGVGIRGRNLISFALALLGVVIISWGDFNLSPRALLGDVMALAAAVCMAGYMIVGKRLRSEIPLSRYLSFVYGGAAVTLVCTVAILGVPPMPQTQLSWVFLLGLAVGPTLVGHTMLNWALAHFPAYRVNLASLFEPVGASIWAWLVLGEVPRIFIIPGALLILTAVALELIPHREEVTV